MDPLNLFGRCSAYFRKDYCIKSKFFGFAYTLFCHTDCTYLAAESDFSKSDHSIRNYNILAAGNNSQRNSQIYGRFCHLNTTGNIHIGIAGRQMDSYFFFENSHKEIYSVKIRSYCCPSGDSKITLAHQCLDFHQDRAGSFHRTCHY